MGFPIKHHCKTCDKDMTDEWNESDCKSDECAECRLKFLQTLHNLPYSADDYDIKVIALRKQREELLTQPLVWVTCPCGRKLALKMAFRCWFCGLTFCNECSKKHFGEKPLLACRGEKY